MASNINKKIKVIIIAIMFICAIATQTKSADIDITKTFKDENLKNEILELAKQATGEENKTKIYETDIDKITKQPGGTSLRLAGKEIKDLSGIEVFAPKDITWIFLDWNEITDLTPLQNFKQLTKISFSGNKVSDLTPLSKIETLENITAINNKIETIKPLVNLKNIKYITLDGNIIKDISSIANWSNLEEISFQNNQIEEIPNLSKLKNLETINLGNNKIQSIKNIAYLENVAKLEIDNNNISNLKGIENLPNLKVLSCSNNQIKEINVLSKLTKLENLNINKNQIQSINSINQNTDLNYLYVDNNQIFEFESLKNNTNLKKYSMYNQNASVEIKEKITAENVLIPLPKLFSSIYDKNSFIYNEKAKTEIIGTTQYEINDNQNIKVNSEDLKNNEIIVKVSDEENTLLNYKITTDTMPPVVKGVEDNKIYFNNVTPKSEDDDINEVILLKDNKNIKFNLGNTIKEKGQYILILRDRAENETRIRFEIKEKEIEEPEKGDINDDGKIDIKDLVLLRKYLINAQKFDKNQEIVADISKDNKIDIKDLVLMRKILISN